MRSHRALLHALIVLALGASRALAAPQGPDEGQLVYVAAEAVEDPALAARLATYGGEEAERFVIALTNEVALDGVDWCLAPTPQDAQLKGVGPRGADDVALTRRLRDADVLVLRGGSFMQWYDTLYPPGRRTHLARALQDYVQTSKPILAYGGACAFLSGGVSVAVEELRKPERNPRRTDPFRARVALGVGPRAMFDADVWTDGSPLRLLRALHTTHLDHGFYFLGEVALELQRDPPQLRVLGPGQVLAYDLSRARRRRTGVDHARLSRLVAGDVWGLATDSVELGDGREAVQAPELGEQAQEGAALAPDGEALAAWLEQHAQRPTRAAVRVLESGAEEAPPPAGPAPKTSGPRNEEVRWTLGWDSDAAGWRSRRAESADTWVGIPFDCDWGPH